MCSKKRSKTGNLPLVQQKIDSILENNRKWIENKTQQSPEFFEKLRGNHTPEILWSVHCKTEQRGNEQSEN